jgi:hypothetical protein|tara:strand:- start:436 stop:612 length:177 start_codon:yes stop_codon:yes gene_type:complete
MARTEKLKHFIVGFRLGAMPKVKEFMMPGKHHKRGPYWFDHYNEGLLAQIRDYRRRNT